MELRIIDTDSKLNPSQSYILSIYDPNNDDDFRYSQYSTERSVVFQNVEPGLYRAHADSPQKLGKNSVDITVNEGDNILITFTYYVSGIVTVGNPYSGYYTVPVYDWKYQVERQ